jgi:hypothetical protein
MSTRITAIHDMGSDILRVSGEYEVDVVNEDGQIVSETRQLVANGWLSATTNHFDPEAYGPDGHHVEGAQPREMTPAEKRAYCQALLDAQHAPEPTATPLNW